MTQDYEILTGEEILEALKQGDLVKYSVNNIEINALYIEYLTERIKDVEKQIIHLADRISTKSDKYAGVLSMKFGLDDIALVERRLTYLHEEFRFNVRFAMLFNKLHIELSSTLEKSLRTRGFITKSANIEEAKKASVDNRTFNEQEYLRLDRLLRLYNK